MLSFNRMYINTTDTAVLVALYFLHWAIVCFFLFYYFVSRRLGISEPWCTRFDIFYLLFAVGILIHWMIFRYECVISYMEKRILHPGYRLGDLPFEHPSLFIGMKIGLDSPFVQLFLFTIWAIIALNIALILLHLLPNRKSYTPMLVAALFVMFITTVLNIYNKLTES